MIPAFRLPPSLQVIATELSPRERKVNAKPLATALPPREIKYAGHPIGRSRYTGEMCRQLRRERGVGRPPHVLAMTRQGSRAALGMRFGLSHLAAVDEAALTMNGGPL